MRVRRISEELQKDEPLMGTLRRIGALPDKVVGVTATDAGVLVGSGGETAELDLEAAGAHLRLAGLRLAPVLAGFIM